MTHATTTDDLNLGDAEQVEDAVMALVDRFGSPWDHDEIIGHAELIDYLDGQGFMGDMAADAALRWRAW